MTLLLHRYRPFTVAALAAIARADLIDRRRADYAGDMIWKIAQVLVGKDFALETPSEYAMRLEGHAQAKPDERTGREIIDGIVAKLEGK